MLPHISLVNHPDSGVADSALMAMAAAIQRQVSEHFLPLWNVDATVAFTTSPAPTDWVVGAFRDADQPGALGYHDTTPTGTPLAKWFPLLDAQDGAEPSVTVSHEILEMLADPYLTRAVQARDGRFWALEVADAVEQDSYLIDGVKVSNFVTPHYFEPPVQFALGDKLDYMGLVKSPYEVRPGGYMQWFGTEGWTQVTNEQLAPRPYRLSVRGRIFRRSHRAHP